ncbi:adiponectin receptor protein isoform X1 [Schistocerca piceifrons]|uniref:adiponectin receptor protein isoform X1 n=1 Tax=Schistocerca piceifrons TaxID=274613 RepID=UPI001F5E68E5|nr:adiponectin receptor protein isoform X1 [Schistocerca piceifrons]XP_049955147.1 adiponectin receptor protein isoform X1 [Schistocerca serialis cubense]
MPDGKENKDGSKMYENFKGGNGKCFPEIRAGGDCPVSPLELLQTSVAQSEISFGCPPVLRDISNNSPVTSQSTSPGDVSRVVADPCSSSDTEGEVSLSDGLRLRRLWVTEKDWLNKEIPELREVRDLLEDDASVLAEEDDGAGCPLPSTPEDEHLLDCEMTEVLKAGVLSDEIDLGALAHNAAEQAEEFVRKVWEASWKVCHFRNLPQWLQDNDYLHAGHRPPLPSFYACFKSIFRIHTETGNIWTHLLGCVAFIGVATYFLTRPSEEVPLQEKLVFAAYFAGAIVCLGMSSAFHTVHCHSECVGKLFSKLDYCGIAMLIMGSFVPWLYYGFYCDFQPKLIYLSVVIGLGVTSIVVSLWDRFSEPKYRSLRAGVFMGFGLSGVVPAVHYAVSEGWFNAIAQASLGWLILMGCLYILGAMFYALRVPERFFPGKCDIWFQSHQIFHVLVIAAAFVHYHGITEMAMYRLNVGECQTRDTPLDSEIHSINRQSL